MATKKKIVEIRPEDLVRVSGGREPVPTKPNEPICSESVCVTFGEIKIVSRKP